MTGGARMAAERLKAGTLDRVDLIRDLQRELRQASIDGGYAPISQSLTLAQMLLAARLLPDSGPDGMGFLDSERELTAPDWQGLLARLPTAWPKRWPAPQATFAFVLQALPPRSPRTTQATRALPQRGQPG